MVDFCKNEVESNKVLSRKDTQKVAYHKYDWKNWYIMLSHIFRKWNPDSSSINDYGTLVKFYWRRQRHPTPVLLPGKSHGQRSLVGYSPNGLKELGMTEQLTMHL